MFRNEIKNVDVGLFEGESERIVQGFEGQAPVRSLDDEVRAFQMEQCR